jgi:hypothetical protein
MNGTRERSRTSLADHLLFTRRRGRQRWKPGFFDHYVDARHGASAYSASIAGRTRRAFGIAARFAFASGANAQPVELRFQRRRLSITIYSLFLSMCQAIVTSLRAVATTATLRFFFFASLRKNTPSGPG